MEKKLKHLEFIQNVITRKNQNSFLIKGWVVALVAALFALAAKDSDQNFILISGLTAASFWLLDGFFLQQERAFRDLYDSVALKAPDQIDFSMAAKDTGIKGWLCAAFSKTFLVFYGAIGVTIVVVSCAMRK